MRKFVVRLADGSEQCLIHPLYDTRNEAVQCIINYVAGFNEDLGMENAGRISPFDFKVEEVEVDDVDGVITSFGLAVEYLCLNGNDKHSVCGRDVAKLLRELNPRHVEALIALNELFTIAEAWNKADGFVPDFSDREQEKYFPWFAYDKDVSQFSPDGSMSSAYVSALLGARLCFKTVERAKQFGLRFAGLFNEFLMLDRREEVSHEDD